MDSSSELWLFTCASGQQCSHLLPLVAELPQAPKLRLAVHSKSSCDRMKAEYPSAEVTKADLLNPKDVKRIIEGVTVVYHIGPPMNPRELSIGRNMIDAAVSQNQNHGGSIRHFVLSSVLHTQASKLLHHNNKRLVEEALIESGLDYTILQPTILMENFPFPMLQQQVTRGEREPVLLALWDPKVKFTFLALKDLAAAALVVLRERQRHFRATYEWSGTREMLSSDDICAIASRKLGVEIQIDRLPFFEAVDRFSKMIEKGSSEKIDPGRLDIATRMLLDYNHRGLTGNPNVLE